MTNGENKNPRKEEKGYQPAKPTDPPRDPGPDGGYQPTQEGDNPTNKPPLGDE